VRAPEFWREDALTARLLMPLAAAYALAGKCRRASTRSWRPPVPVICVGNLVAGGAGKTPVALSVIERLKARGIAVHALTRGYGGDQTGPLRVDPQRHDAKTVGDEALLLARAAPTWVAADRRAGARAGIAEGAEALVLDDGFQNPSLAKDLSLLVVDGAYGFGNGRVLPAGPLREPIAAGMARTDAVVLLGEDAFALARRYGDDRPWLQASLGPTRETPDLAGRRVIAFAGIGRPEKFFASLAEAGASLAETRSFDDHHPYSASELEEILTRAEAIDALPVTTEKDAKRLPEGALRRVAVFPVAVTWRDPAALTMLLDRVFDHGQT
jgi:tetraacyldisaccharide 4'-kinase